MSRRNTVANGPGGTPGTVRRNSGGGGGVKEHQSTDKYHKGGIHACIMFLRYRYSAAHVLLNMLKTDGHSVTAESSGARSEVSSVLAAFENRFFLKKKTNNRCPTRPSTFFNFFLFTLWFQTVVPFTTISRPCADNGHDMSVLWFDCTCLATLSYV